jgi:hypothetical protein
VGIHRPTPAVRALPCMRPVLGARIEKRPPLDRAALLFVRPLPDLDR